MRSPSRERLRSFAPALLALALGACSLQGAGPAEPGSALLEEAQRATQNRDYAAYEAHLASGESEGRETALLQLAVLHLLESPLREPASAHDYLERLLAEFPDGELGPAAQVLLELIDESRRQRLELRELEERLEQLKRIDLEPDPPSG